MTWAAYLLGQHWPLLATTLIFATLIVLLTRDRKDQP